MNEEELYKLAISDVPKYSLLNEILAIRDNRYPDEETDYTIKVYGSISLEVLNNYARNINELERLQNNWNTLKGYLNVFKQIYADPINWERRKLVQVLLKKMQELEQVKDE